MNKKQFVILFVCNCIPGIIGNYMFALLPIYAARLGADSASIGNYLALSFAALTVGTIGAGWLSNRFGRHKVFIVGAGVICCVCTGLISLIPQFWALVPLTIVVWLSAGTFQMTTIMAGLFTAESERGKIFGILGLNIGIGQLVGGALSGLIVDRWGFSILFLSAAVGWLMPSLIALFLKDKVRPRTVLVRSGHERGNARKVSLGSVFYILLLAAVFSAVPGIIVALGRPLLMDRLGFDPAQISGVVAISGAISLPFPLILSWLSARLGRYRLIAFCYLLVMSAMAIMVIATTLWQFWLSAVFLAIAGSAGVVGLVLVGELVPRQG